MSRAQNIYETCQALLERQELFQEFEAWAAKADALGYDRKKSAKYQWKAGKDGKTMGTFNLRAHTGSLRV